MLVALVFVFLASAASPAHFWLDSGEIAAAGAVLDVMHPMGVPGYVPMLHLATALPRSAPPLAQLSTDRRHRRPAWHA